ncbi:MAG TPA: CaiB/BaiF CoA-transferase family protein [Planococcus sp. (in: firmicutes)]|nr:CaiB/BaiF CoA-transferase family protein [Planococcus sp. (in: firmicutes)]
MENALKGIRVLDVTYYVPGPYAGMRLAGMGAEVIKIEPPAGDPARYMGGGLVHEANNIGKTIIAIDLKSEEGHQEMLELVKTADVLLETFRPGVMEKLGLGYETLKRIKPDLVYCSLSGYGQRGPLALLGSHDLNYMALSGALEQMSDTVGRPVHPANTFADYTGGLLAAEQIVSALLRKFRTGEGTHLDIALAEVMAEFQGNHDIYHSRGNSEHGIPEIGGSRISYAIYETKDGRYVTLGALEEKFWHNFCELAGQPEWQSWSAKAPGSREHEQVASFFKERTWQEWYDASLTVDCCLAPVLKAHERVSHPQFKARGNRGPQ